MSSSEVDILRSMDDEPDTPSKVDIWRAIDTGRRQKKRRRAAGYAGAAAVTALAVAGTAIAAGAFASKASPQVAASKASATVKPKPAYTIPGTPGWHAPAVTAPTSCTLEQAPIPDHLKMALISGADPTGHYQVGRSYPKDGYQAVVWHDGTATNALLPGDLEESLRDVNSTGTAVGWSYAASGDSAFAVPYAYRDGKATRLAGTGRGSALAINDAGAIVGDDDKGTALVWPSLTARPIKLPVPAGTSKATANGIDEDGTVVGSLDEEKPYVWFADGTHRRLPMPDLGGKPALIAQAFDIRNGWVTGMASPASAKDARGKSSARVWAVRWNLRTGEVQAVDKLQYPADSVNAQGWQIGNDKQGYAVMVTDAGTIRLPDLAAHNADGTSTIANAVSDDGRTIAGQSDDASGTIKPVIWRCH